MTQNVRSAQEAEGGRVPWVETAKGICIVLVVMMHSTLGVGDAMGHEGFMHGVVAFAQPFPACPTSSSSRACSYCA